MIDIKCGSLCRSACLELLMKNFCCTLLGIQNYGTNVFFSENRKTYNSSISVNNDSMSIFLGHVDYSLDLCFSKKFPAKFRADFLGRFQEFQIGFLVLFWTLVIIEMRVGQFLTKHFFCCNNRASTSDTLQPGPG